MISALALLLVPQSEDLIYIIKVCRELDRNSWEWLLNWCWLYEGMSPAMQDGVAFVVSSGLALLSAKVLRWFAGRR